MAAYVLTNLAVIILRESKLVNYQPSFKVPLYPWLQMLNIAIFLLLIIDLGAEAIEINLVLIFIGLSFYMFYGRKRTHKESALLHLLDRVTARELTFHLSKNSNPQTCSIQQRGDISFSIG